MIVNKVFEHVKSKYDTDEYNWFHILFVREKAVSLAKLLSVDKEIVDIAALFHDVDCSDRENHAINSAKYAMKFLKEINYPEEKIDRISNAILCHSSKITKKKENLPIEVKILYDADKMWGMTPKGFARTIAHRYQQNKSYDFIIKKLEKAINKFDKLYFDESRELVKVERQKCIEFLEEMKNTKIND